MEGHFVQHVEGDGEVPALVGELVDEMDLHQVVQGVEDFLALVTSGIHQPFEVCRAVVDDEGKEAGEGRAFEGAEDEVEGGGFGHRAPCISD